MPGALVGDVARLGPCRSQPHFAGAALERKIVVPAGIAAEQGRPLRIADIDRIRERHQRLRQPIVGRTGILRRGGLRQVDRGADRRRRHHVSRARQAAALGSREVHAIGQAFPRDLRLRIGRRLDAGERADELVVEAGVGRAVPDIPDIPARGDLQRRPQIAIEPAGDAALVPVVVRRREQTDGQLLERRRRQTLDVREAREDGERALQLAERHERAPVAERRQVRRVTRRRCMDARAADAHAFQRQHEHAKARQRADGHQRVGQRGRVDRSLTQMFFASHPASIVPASFDCPSSRAGSPGMSMPSNAACQNVRACGGAGRPSASTRTRVSSVATS